MTARNAEIGDLLKEVRQQGAQVRLGKSGHWKVYNPSTHRSISLPATPGDHRAIKNAITRLRRIGLVISRERRGTSRRPRLGSALAR